MKRGQPTGVASGFTFVEIMIVLAVTGFLFVSVAVTFSGRQQKSAFTTAAQDIRLRIQQTITEVSNGYFPSTNNFSCTSSAANSITINAGGGGPSQGSNKPCVFLGKVMQFTTSGDPQPYYINTVAGYRATVYTGLDNLDPTYVTPVREQLSLKNGLTFVSMKYNGGNISSVGFMYSLGAADSNGDFATGAQHVDVYAITDSSSAFTANGDMNGQQLVSDGQGVQICFKSGGTDKYGIVTVGGQRGVTSATLKITTACT
ncbi:type II secretion system protein [Candidatus Saccharibacteria bacterium]|nr:type II secretion system protein [Candidatus Saccharibacteria bacterium]